VKNIRVPSS